MKEVTEIYTHSFMLTGDTYDPKDLDFTFYTNVRITSNPDETPAMKEYFMNYDSATDTFSNLAVRCTYTYETTPVTKTTEDIVWFLEDGSEGTTRQLVQVQE